MIRKLSFCCKSISLKDLLVKRLASIRQKRSSPAGAAKIQEVLKNIKPQINTEKNDNDR